MRTFIAVDIPDDVKKAVGQYIDDIKTEFKGDVKWVSPDNLHFTIKFLGEVKKSAIDVLRDCIDKTAPEFEKFYINLSDIGFFPSDHRPRIIWLGAHNGADRMLDIFQELETCLEEYGFDREAKTFSPHLTIGRVKKHRKIVVPERIDEFEAVSFLADGLSLVKSTLTPNGPIYETMFKSSFDSDYVDVLPEGSTQRGIKAR